MKTLRISRTDMERRISRFGALKPLPIQNETIPEKARDVVYARKLLSVIGLRFEVSWNDDGAELHARGEAAHRRRSAGHLRGIRESRLYVRRRALGG